MFLCYYFYFVDNFYGFSIYYVWEKFVGLGSDIYGNFIGVWYFVCDGYYFVVGICVVCYFRWFLLIV